MSFITRFLGRRDFSLPEFDLQLLRLELSGSAEDELVLDRLVARSEDGKVIALGQPLPTAGELRESIERHLRETRGSGPEPSAVGPVDELRDALAELRRSLR